MTSSPDAVDTAPPSPLPAPRKGLALTALILGIAAFVAGWIPGLGIVLGLVAIVFGVIALVKRQSKPLAITGASLGAVGLVASSVMTAVAVFIAPAVIAEVEAATPSVSEETTVPDAAEEAPEEEAVALTREDFTAIDAAGLDAILADVNGNGGANHIVYGEVVQSGTPESECSAFVYIDAAQQSTWEGYQVPAWVYPTTADATCSGALIEGSHVALWATVLGAVETTSEDGTVEDVLAVEAVFADQLAPLG